MRAARVCTLVFLALSAPATVGQSAAQVPAPVAAAPGLDALVLPTSTRVLVVLSDGTPVRGTFAGHYTGGVRLLMRHGNQTFSGARIARIFTVKGRTPRRGALLGAAIGAAAALVTELIVPDEDFNFLSVFAIVGVVSTPVGAAVGAVTAHETLTLVYENPSIPGGTASAAEQPREAPDRLYLSAGGGPAGLGGLVPEGATDARRRGVGRSAAFAATYRRSVHWGVRGDFTTGRTATTTWTLPIGGGQVLSVDGTRRILAGGVGIQRFVPVADRHEVRIGGGASVVRQTSGASCRSASDGQGSACVAGVNALDYFLTTDAGYYAFVTDHVGVGGEARFSWGRRRDVLTQVAAMVSLRR
jgi:hypothetical protein